MEYFTQKSEDDMYGATARGAIKEEKEYKQYLEKCKSEFWDRMKTRYKTEDVRIEDLKRLRVLGTGSFGHVLLAQHKVTEKYYALKVLDKADIVRRKQVEHTLFEKNISLAVNFPFAINTLYTDKDNTYLYFVLPYLNGGELFHYLKSMKTFTEHVAKFYGAQICLALEYLHALNLVYRDLKPENILLDHRGYAKIIDYGFCKVVTTRTYTFVGTPEYVAPEIICGKGYGKAVDWWSYGVLLYEMCAGASPFVAKEQIQIFDKICTGRYQPPKHFSPELRDIIRNLLQIDLSRRYGNLKNGAYDIKYHKWYKSMNWKTLFEQKMESPLKPEVHGPSDTKQYKEFSNFDMRVAANEQFALEFSQF